MGMTLLSGRRRRRSALGPMAEINITPLVDVMLVLLIIFMVTAPLLKAAVPVELPQTRAQAAKDERDQLSITVSRDGLVYIDREAVAPGELAQRLARVARGPDGRLPVVDLRADKAIDWGQAMGLMGELNRAGFTAISLVSSPAPAAAQDR